MIGRRIKYSNIALIFTIVLLVICSVTLWKYRLNIEPISLNKSFSKNQIANSSSTYTDRGKTNFNISTHHAFNISKTKKNIDSRLVGIVIAPNKRTAILSVLKQANNNEIVYVGTELNDMKIDAIENERILLKDSTGSKVELPYHPHIKD